ncbi:MAG: hypothetical protein OEW08_07500 [Gammaproteobacteria bacterium]|nr:hypothetical protein [Gammaproteobacteria bacterium]
MVHQAIVVVVGVLGDAIVSGVAETSGSDSIYPDYAKKEGAEALAMILFSA